MLFLQLLCRLVNVGSGFATVVTRKTKSIGHCLHNRVCTQNHMTTNCDIEKRERRLR